jgi:hypothetical protein
MLCLWVNGQLNTAICEPSRILELQVPCMTGNADLPSLLYTITHDYRYCVPVIFTVLNRA